MVIVLGAPFLNDLEIHEKIKKAHLLIYIGPFKNIWSDMADIVLPGQYYSEKEGTYINKGQIVQSTEIVVQALRRTRPEWQILSEFSKAIGLENSFEKISQVFDTMTSEVKAFYGLKYDEINGEGVRLKNKINDTGMRLIKSR